MREITVVNGRRNTKYIVKYRYIYTLNVGCSPYTVQYRVAVAGYFNFGKTTLMGRRTSVDDTSIWIRGQNLNDLPNSATARSRKYQVLARTRSGRFIWTNCSSSGHSKKVRKLCYAWPRAHRPTGNGHSLSWAFFESIVVLEYCFLERHRMSSIWRLMGYSFFCFCPSRSRVC